MILCQIEGRLARSLRRHGVILRHPEFVPEGNCLGVRLSGFADASELRLRGERHTIGRDRRAIRRVERQQGLLPAFSSLAAGADIRRRPGRQIYAIGENKIFRL